MNATVQQKIDAICSKKGQAPVSELTAYDYPTARLLDEAGIDMILVGDSVGMVVLGYPDTTHVTLAHMIHHTQPVARAAKHALVIADMPIHTYDTPPQALETARALVSAGAEAVKLEGGLEKEEHIRTIVQAGIPVQGHIGLQPQKVLEEKGFHMKGKTEAEVEKLMQDVAAITRAGVFSYVIECTRAQVAAAMTQASPAISIGIGAGNGTCDGQVAVIHDLVGGFPWFVPRFATPRADISAEIRRAAGEYIQSLILPQA